MNFYHITTPEHWAKFKDQNVFEADSLATEGFIHGSYPAQLEETLALYYKNVPQVFLLDINPSRLQVELKVEGSRGGAFFPHIYGQINKSAIDRIVVRDLSIGK
jgi:uncharacterized protein (DUF952 family)